jgi:UDP-glucuronate 4-epimerase
MKVLVTGIAGFIGFHVVRYLVRRGDVVVGLDNINAYYDVELKYARLNLLGIDKDQIKWHEFTYSSIYDNLSFIRINLEDRDGIKNLFLNENFDRVCNLAAQAGVRYSIENPHIYIDSNISGFLNILEGCRYSGVNHLIFASSSSVYGLNGKVPFSEKDGISHPVSLYAATKASNELMAHVYSQLYNISCTGLRFFTVYGPWGRPDMSPFLFIDAILHDRSINVFNNGYMIRDFTYIDDIVEGVVRVLDHSADTNSDWDAKFPDPSSSSAPYRIYNIGNSEPVMLMDFIRSIEKAIGKNAKKEYLPMQAGDVYQTNADTNLLQSDFGFKPTTSIDKGIEETVKWFQKHYKV